MDFAAPSPTMSSSSFLKYTPTVCKSVRVRASVSQIPKCIPIRRH
jgi:hypothetical protein